MSTSTPSTRAAGERSRWTVAVNRFLADARGRDLEASTIAHYQYHLAGLAARAGTPGPGEMTAELLQRWLDQAPGSEATREQARKVARLFFEWAAREQLVRCDPYAELAELPASALWHPSWTLGLEAMAVQLRARGRADLTVRHYELHVGWLAAALPDVDAWDVMPEQVTSWVDGEHWSQNTRRKVLAALRAFYAQGINDGLCARSPLAGVSALPPRVRGPEQLAATPQWQEPLRRFIEWMQAGNKADGTIRLRRWHVVRLSETFADPWAVTRRDLALWLSRGDWSPATRRSTRSSIQVFYEWAELEDLVETSPARNLPRVTAPRALPRPVDDDALAQALATADDRMRFALQVLTHTGLRCGELARLHTRDVLEDRIRVRGKGGHDRWVPMSPDLQRIVRTELRRRHTGVDIGIGWGPSVPTVPGYIFPSDDPTRHLTPAYLGKLIGRQLPDHWTAHTIRHRAGSVAYASGRDLRAVQELLGHQKPETTAIYAAVPQGAVLAAVASLGVTRPALA